MAQLRSFDADEIARLAPLPAAIAELRACFANAPEHIARSQIPAAGGELLLMPAVAGGVAGIKLLMIQPGNAALGQPVIQGTYVLFDAAAGRPIALLDGAALTNVRTPAISAVATDVLGRPDARTLGIIGSGPQATGHLEAMLVVRPDISEVVIASRTEASASALAARLAGDAEITGSRRVRVGSIEDAAGSDIVCTATRATEPIVTAAMVRPGAHINAVGAYRTDMRELAGDLVAASTVYVDDIHAAHEEAGDLDLAARDGDWEWGHLAGELADLAAGRRARRDVGEITLFKSVGLAVEDLVIARLVAASEHLL